MSTSNEERTILDASREVWQGVMGLDLAPSDEKISADEELFGTYVHITSEDWNRTVLLESSRPVTLHAAAVLFEIDAESVGHQDLQDAHNELARLVAKGVRAACAEKAKVSAPKSASQGAETPALAAMKPVQAMDLTCEGRPIRLSLFQPVEAQTTR